MSVKLHDLAHCLLEVEAELRRLGWWSEQAPHAAALASREPFCLDTLRFEQWLQWVFLPRMHALIRESGDLPQHSAITEMAEVSYMEILGKTVVLRRHLKRLDRLLSRE
ncbi:MAG: YqcC family protein [Thiopseudomonas sp.]|nr:YqcC family protein [Thiopseudomonas sp.]